MRPGRSPMGTLCFAKPRSSRDWDKQLPVVEPEAPLGFLVLLSSRRFQWKPAASALSAEFEGSEAQDCCRWRCSAPFCLSSDPKRLLNGFL